MKIILDSKINKTIHDESIILFKKLIESILTKQLEIKKIIKTQRQDFPDDKWIMVGTDIDLHFFRQSDGSRRSRRVIHAHYINWQPSENTLLHHYVTIK